MADKTYADLTAATDMQDTDLLASWRVAGPGPLKKIAASIVRTYMLATLGTASLKNTGTSGNTVPLLDGANTWSAKQTIVDQAAGDNSGAAANTRFVAAAVANLGSRGYIDGLLLSTAGASATFGVSAGEAVDSTGVAVLALASAFTKTTGSWAVGTGNGAILTGTIANDTWYHAFLIQRPDSGLVDIGLDTVMDPTAHLPTNYTLFRYIGSIKTDGSAQWVKFYQDGDNFLWDLPTMDHNASDIGTTASLITLNVPPNVRVTATGMGGYGTGSGINFIVTSPDQSDADPASVGLIGSNANTQLSVPSQQRTDASAQVRVRSTANGTFYQWTTSGWIDVRGKS